MKLVNLVKRLVLLAVMRESVLPVFPQLLLDLEEIVNAVLDFMMMTERSIANNVTIHVLNVPIILHVPSVLFQPPQESMEIIVDALKDGLMMDLIPNVYNVEMNANPVQTQHPVTSASNLPP